MIHHGDCVEVMATMPENSVDAIVCDPPYGLEFMGKEWDRLGGGVTGTLQDADPFALQRGGSLPFGGGGQRVRYGASATTMQEWHQRWATEALRVAKPGAYLLAFGGTRTVHRLAVAIEDAGWIIRDCLVWAYAQGFPKSRSLLKPAWEPIVMARKPGPLRELAIDECRIPSLSSTMYEQWNPTSSPDNEPYPVSTSANSADEKFTTSELEVWSESFATAFVGTRLDGSVEPPDISRPDIGCLPGTMAEGSAINGSIAESGKTLTDPSHPATSSTTSTKTGTTTGSKTSNLSPEPSTPLSTSHSGHGRKSDRATARDHSVTENDASASLRPNSPPVPAGRANEPSAQRRYADSGTSDFAATPGPRGGDPTGRWPSNVILTSPIFDGDTAGVVGGGEAKAGIAVNRNRREMFSPSSYGWEGHGTEDFGYGDTGTYSRFFLIPKADRAEREPNEYSKQAAPLTPFLRGETMRLNPHPTVKPLDLMRHLVRLVTPTGGTVLDPFLGSGTTAIAAEMEGFAWIGIEREAEYVAIAEARLMGVQKGLGLDVPAPTPVAPNTHPDLAKHQPKRRNVEQTSYRGFAGTDVPKENDAA